MTRPPRPDKLAQASEAYLESVDRYILAAERVASGHPAADASEVKAASEVMTFMERGLRSVIEPGRRRGARRPCHHPGDARRCHAPD